MDRRNIVTSLQLDLLHVHSQQAHFYHKKRRNQIEDSYNNLVEFSCSADEPTDESGAQEPSGKTLVAFNILYIMYKA